MEVLSDLSSDQVEQQLIETEAIVARLRAHQAELLAEADRRQLPTGDGCRTLAEWTASRLDVSHETARDLVRLCRSSTERSSIFKRLAAGEWSVDRTVESDRWVMAGATESDVVADSTRFDISGLRNRAALGRRMTPIDEETAFAGRYLVTQRSLDRSYGRLWGQLAGDDMDRVEHALVETADSFPPLPDGARPTRPQRMADALVALTTGQTAPEAAGPTQEPSSDLSPPTRTSGTLSVFVDQQAAQTSGGYRIGESVIEELLCDAHHETTLLLANGAAIEAGGHNTVTNRQRRRIQYRHKTCAADGCASRYRLQVHHRTWQSAGGTHADDNLTLLCWYHHHIVIHRYGFSIHPDSPSHRLRFFRPTPPQRE